MGNTHRTPSPAAPPSQESDERTRRAERILDAAALLLVRWGYRKTTIDDVAREAGVGKGTIYLHWKDKTELFQAAIWRESQHVTDETLQRLAADPEGGRFHRLWTHGMLAIFENPLMAALMKGRSDIFQGLMETMPSAMRNQIVGNAEAHVIQLQEAGLIRADLPVATIVYLMGAMKIGIMHMADVVDQTLTPSIEELTEALSELMRRWLEPAHPPTDSDAGKQIMADWLNQVNDLVQHQD
jgi:AcrR family transcriptional regulator